MDIGDKVFIRGGPRRGSKSYTIGYVTAVFPHKYTAPAVRIRWVSGIEGDWFVTDLEELLKQDVL